MGKPIKSVTPANRVDRWKKLWATPVRLSDAATEDAFGQFRDEFVPRHMHKYFLKSFGVPKAQFGNRFFMEDAQYRSWDMRLSSFLGEGSPIHATVIYGSPDAIEAYQLRGERRRTLRDVIIDDWQAACAIVQAPEATIYFFVEPKMRGCIVRIDRADGLAEPDTDEAEMID